MDDLLREFLAEASENVDSLDAELVRLERDPGDPEILGNVFRLVHTIKGTCGFLDLPRLEAVSHAAEDVLGSLRDGGAAASPETVALILAALDRIKAILAAIAETGGEPEGEDGALIGRLETALLQAAPAEPPGPGRGPAEAGRQAPPAAGRSIRADVAVLDDLMTLAGELVLARNQLVQAARRDRAGTLAAPLERLSRITGELQRGILKTRMQPIGSAWSRLPRIVRDLAHSLGKEIALDIEGADTELDREVIETIRDPLTHMVRNACDHGIEPPAEREAAGKPAVATIRLAARNEAGGIVVEVSDDGRGLASEKIRRRARAAGLASKRALEAMGEAELHRLIFTPGFSTAEAVTDVSGRGVGMDVVRTNVERIGGRIEVRSAEGRGTTFTIEIPLTLAIVQALIVGAGGQRFAIPQPEIFELVRIAPDGVHRIERIDETPVMRLRDRLLPVVPLAGRLGLAPGETSEEAFVVVARSGAVPFGILVEKLLDSEEIVVKPVAPILRRAGVYAGMTILGDGGVVMILDAAGIAGEIAEEAAEASAEPAARPQPETAGFPPVPVVVFRAGGGVPKVVPLCHVARLEEIDLAGVERAGARPVVPYGGRIMPLVALEPGTAIAAEGRWPVIVLGDGERRLGLVVEHVLDIVEDRLEVEPSTARAGILGSAVVAGRPSEVIDASALLGAGPPPPDPLDGLGSARRAA